MNRESRVAVISGIPGSGKTTLAGTLAAQSEQGVHIEADAFHGFLAHPVDPYSPESRSQAEAVAKAVASSARAFAGQGYQVFVDGVIGPWNLSVYEDLLGSFDYAILEVDTETAIDRMRKRGDAKLEHEGVANLRGFFHKFPGVLSRHALSAVESSKVLAQEFERRRAVGGLRRKRSASSDS